MINALFAVDYYGGMGLNGTLPWPIDNFHTSDFDNFTKGHIVVMGRRTWDYHIATTVPNQRIYYVASSKPISTAHAINGDLIAEVLELELQHQDKIIWIAGGAQLIEKFKDTLDNIYVNHKRGSYKNDTKIDLKSFLTGFFPVKAEVSRDYTSTLINYKPIFKRNTNL